MNDNELCHENENQNNTNDSSYIVLEDSLYCSSPIRGIKSKSNVSNTNCAITPSNINSNDNLFTFSVFREPSTDICSKEEPLNSQKSTNLINDFSLSYLKNSKSITIEYRKENMKISVEKEEKEKKVINDINEEMAKEIKRKKNNQKEKYKSKKMINNCYLSNLEDNLKNYNTEKKRRNSQQKKTFILDENKNKEKKIKRKNKRYASIDYLTRQKLNKQSNNIGRFSSKNITKDISGNNKIKSHYYEEDYLDSNNKKKNEEEKCGLKDVDKHPHHKRKKIKTKKLDYIRPSMSSKNNDIMKYNDGFKNGKKRKKKENLFLDNKDNDFEDNNYISHPIKSNKEKAFYESNLLTVKSPRYTSQKHFFLVKEMDRDFDAIDQINKLVNSDTKVFKNLKNKLKQNNKNFAEKDSFKSKERMVSDFFDSRHGKKEINCNNGSPIFRKSNNKNINDHEAYKTRKTSQFCTQFDKNKEKECKLRSSINLNKLNKRDFHINKKNIDTKESINKTKFKRRHTIFITNKNKDIFTSTKNDKIDKSSSFFSEEISDKGYDDDCSSSNYESTKHNMKSEKKKRMKITDDKLIFNYQDKEETIKVLSDKENIDNYYEYLEFCYETLQQMNINEVPKAKIQIDFKFIKEKKKKKIALFDLDETLVHCIGEINSNNSNDPKFKNAHKINVVLPCKKEVTIGINIRPHLIESLDKIKDVYNLVIFTASHRSYSDAVLNYLDPKDKYFHYRLYRDSCVQYKTNDMNFYVKDLDIFNDNYDLKDIIIIDNSILSFAYHINNGIPVIPFYDSDQDSELPLLSFYLLTIASYKDLREANKEHIKLEHFLSQSKNEKSLEEITMLESMNLNSNINDNSIINSIKLSICSGSPKNVNYATDNKNYKMSKDNSNNLIRSFDLENNEQKDNSYDNKSEKKKINFIRTNSNQFEKKKSNTVKLESFKMDFFEKWKNAYLQLALKK